jgi:hypothetical protein
MPSTPFSTTLVSTVCLGALLLAPLAADAQEAPPEVRELASALVDEQKRIAELKAELDRRSAVLAELTHNLRAASDGDTAVSFRFDAGRAQRKGDWNFGWHIFRIEQDAILAGLGESDWRAPSNVLQQRFGLDRMVHSNVQLSFTLYLGRTLDRTLPGALFAPGLPPVLRDPWTNRIYWDITYRY